MVDRSKIVDALHAKQVEFLRSPEFEGLTHEQRLDRWDQMVTEIHDRMDPLVLPEPSTPSPKPEGT